MPALRAALRGLLVVGGITLLVASGIYLAGGLLGFLPLELETPAWNNIRIVSGFAILGCLMAAVGYGNE